MTGPTWLRDVVAAAMTVTALYCAGRVVVARLRSRLTEADVDLVHVAMGLGMADMLLRPPGTAVQWLGLVGFGAAAVYFLTRSVRQDGGAFRPLFGAGHHLQHAVGSGAMLVMFLPGSRGVTGPSSMAGMAKMSGMTGMSGMAQPSALGQVSIATGALALVLLGFALTTAGRLVSARWSPGLPTGTVRTVPITTPPLLAPRLAMGCQALMSAAMCWVLLMS